MLLGVQGETLESIKASLAWRVASDMEARATESRSHRRARDLLREDFARVPDAKEDRDALRDYTSFLAQLSGALMSRAIDPATVAETYGADTERVLANPYIQDQLLGNAACWKSVVVLGRAIIGAPTPGVLNTPSRVEARKFLDAYDSEMPKCVKLVESALAGPGSAAVASTWRPICDYTRARVHPATTSLDAR